MRARDAGIDRSRYPGITDEGWKALEAFADLSNNADPQSQRMAVIAFSMADSIQRLMPRREVKNEDDG